MGKSASQAEFKATSTIGKVAAIYVRVSSNEYTSAADGEKELRQSVKTQESDGIRVCKEKGWEYRVYKNDCEYSGTMGPDERKDLQRLLDDIKAGQIHTVIVREIDRIARSSYHFQTMMKDYFRPYGIVLHGTNQPLDITTPSGRAFLEVFMAFAQFEVDQRKLSSMRNRAAKAKEGTLLLNPYTYGYDNNRGSGPLVIVEHEAKIVRRIFEMYTNEHLSVQRIATRLNEEGVPTKWKHQERHKDALWMAAQIWRTLRNRRYIGQIEYNKEVLPSPFPPIISMDMWKATEDEIHRRSKVAPRVYTSRHLLSGILKCGYCLDGMAEKTAKGIKIAPGMVMSQAGTKDKPHLYYTCQTRSLISAKHCRGARVPKEKIENLIEQFIAVFTAEQYSEVATNNAEVQERLTRDIQGLQKQLARVQKKRDALAAKFLEAASMNVETLVKADDLAKQEISRLEREIAGLQRDLSEVSLAESRDAFDKLKRWRQLDLQTKRRALQKAIPMMVMYEDRLELFVGSVKKRPTVVPYVATVRRRKARNFPKISPTWPVFVGDGMMVQYGANLDHDGKLRAYM